MTARRVRRLLTIRAELMVLTGLLLAAIAVFIYAYFPSRFERRPPVRPR